MNQQQTFSQMVEGMIGGGMTPQSIIQNRMQQNPQMAQMFNNLQAMKNGSKMSSKDFTLQWCKQNGIPEDEVMKVAQRLGLK